MTPYYANPSTTQNVTFRAVKVTGGRKYRGTGFIVAVTQSSGACGWKHNGYGWQPNYYETSTARIWVPALGKFQFANCNYVEDDDSVTQAERDTRFREYTEKVIADTIAWCKSVKPSLSDKEIHQFARNVLLKHHPEMKDVIEAAIPDSRDLKVEIEKTVKWACSLTTRPCYMYGRMCRGGKHYSNEKYRSIARRALEKKGFASKEGFEQLLQEAFKAAGIAS